MPNANNIEDWLAWLERVRHARSSTLHAYGATLHKFNSFVIDMNPDDSWSTITPQTIEAFLLRPRRDREVGAAATQSRDLSCVQSFYRFLKMRGVVPNDPTVDVPIPMVRNRQPKAISDDVWEKLWLADLPAEDRVWLGLGCFAGLRRREIISLSPTQVDAKRGLLFGVSRKGGAEDTVEYVEMATILHERLPRFLPDIDQWLADVEWLSTVRTGERCLITMDLPTTAAARRRHSLTDPNLPAPTVLNKRLTVLLRMAGLPISTFSPHALRHTCATNLLRAGLPIEVVADCLGHSSPAITMRYSKTAGRLREWRKNTA